MTSFSTDNLGTVHVHLIFSLVQSIYHGIYALVDPRGQRLCFTCLCLFHCQSILFSLFCFPVTCSGMLFLYKQSMNRFDLFEGTCNLKVFSLIWVQYNVHPPFSNYSAKCGKQNFAEASLCNTLISECTV